MLNLLRALFLGRSRGFGPFKRRVDPVVTPRRGGMALGTIATLLAPFLLRKLSARRAERARMGAY